jgi:hypothetical protein
MRYLIKKKQYCIFLIVCLTIRPIFCQLPSKVAFYEILLVNYSNSLWPNLSKSNQSYDYSKIGDSLVIKIISEKLIITSKDSNETIATSTSWTSIKKQTINIPIEMNENINVVILLIGDSLIIDDYSVYTFVKKRKDDFFKLKYLNKNAKKNKRFIETTITS